MSFNVVASHEVGALIAQEAEGLVQDLAREAGRGSRGGRARPRPVTLPRRLVQDALSEAVVGAAANDHHALVKHSRILIFIKVICYTLSRTDDPKANYAQFYSH